MTFATEVLKPSLEKFVLVRFKPRKYVGVGVVASANFYTFSVDLPSVDAVEINGATTDVIGFTFTGGVLTVNSGLDLEDVTNVVVAEFHLHFTGSTTRDSVDQFLSGRPEKIWEPRIETNPSWAQSMRNIGEGVFSLSNTDVTLLSTDGTIQGYFGETFSWNRAVTQIWACVGDVSTCRVVFSGEVVSAQLTSSRVTLSVADDFQKLNQTATFGSKVQSYCIDGSAFTPYLQPADVNRPIPMILGRSSPLILGAGYRISEAFGSPAPTGYYHLADGLKCVPITDNLATATSVTFLCGKVKGFGIKYMVFGTISAAYEHYVTKYVYNDASECEVWVKFTYLQCSGFSGEIGDYIPSLNSWVCAVGSFTHAATSFNLAVCDLNYYFDGVAVTSGAIAAPSLSSTIPSMSLWIDGKEPASYLVPAGGGLSLTAFGAYPSYSGRYIPFTLSVDTQNINGYAVSFIYATVTAASIGSINPGKLPIKCRFSPEAVLPHGDALEMVVLNAGMSVNATSFADADTEFEAEVITCIPSFGEAAFPTYLQVAQLITSSTFGMLRVNTSREVEYVLLDVALDGAASGSRDTVNMLEGETSANVEYQDIATDILFQNDNFRDSDSTSTTSASFPVAAALHKQGSSKVFKHALLRISDRSDILGKYISSPKVEYTFSTASEDLTSAIGDKLTITNPAVADSSQSSSGVIVSIETSSQKTNVIINELRGVL